VGCAGGGVRCWRVWIQVNFLNDQDIAFWFCAVEERILAGNLEIVVIVVERRFLSVPAYGEAKPDVGTDGSGIQQGK